MKTSILRTLVFALATLIFSSSAFAHGRAEPLYGGVAKTEQDVVFELVREETGTSLYVHQHGKAYPIQKLSAKLKIKLTDQELESKFIPAGNNKMTTDSIIPDNSKVLVKVKKKNRRWVTARYSF